MSAVVGKNLTTHQEWHEVTLLALPFVIFLYPAIALLITTSAIPIYFNRYSLNLLVFNVIAVSIYGTFVLGLLTRRSSIQFIAILSLVALSLAALSNNSLLGLPAIEATLQMTRVSAGVALLVIAFRADKNSSQFLARCSIALGASLGIAGFLDLSWNGATSVLPTDKSAQIYSSYRTSYDLAGVRKEDIVLVGDSFIWGAGISVEGRIGDILERRLQETTARPSVYSLGIIGADTQGYIRQVQDVPSSTQARRVIIFFYANDMPPRANLQDTLQQLAFNLGRSSVTMRVIVDFSRVVVTPNERDYAALLLANFDESDRTFPARWRQLEDQLAILFHLAKERSWDAPVLVLLPMLVDFEAAAFDAPLRRVGEVATRVGFQVVETMPAFRADGLAAEAYRAKPGDLHLNERGNRIVADLLFRLLTNASAARVPPPDGPARRSRPASRLQAEDHVVTSDNVWPF